MTTQLNKPGKLTHDELVRFRGTTQYYRYSRLFGWFVLTDGTRYLAERGQCYWLMDKIASLQMHRDIKNHPQLKGMQFWWLDVRDDRTATLSCDWDKGQTVYKEEIPWTDFPLNRVEILVSPTWLEDIGRVKVAFLPSEY